MTPAPSTSFSHPHVPPSGLALLRRLPDILSSPIQLATRRKLLREWVSAHAYLRGTTLVVTARLHPTFTLAIDVKYIQFVTSPSSKRPTIILKSSNTNISSVRLRLSHKAADWIRTLTSIINTPVPNLNNFNILYPIGKGGGGEVYVITYKNEYLAMKVIQKHAVFMSPSTLRRALDERLGLEIVRDFPFIVKLQYAFQTSNYLYMITNYYSGGDLKNLLKKSPDNKLTETYAKKLMSQIILALQFIHSQRILFRDLKPENVLLNSNGDIRLCDFGLCKILSPPPKPVRARSFCGSTMYMSPQIVSAKVYGYATDLWSLGALFYKMIIGKAPFEQYSQHQYGQHGVQIRNDAADVHTRILNDRPAIPNCISKDASQLIVGLLKKHEHERWTLQQVKDCAFFSGVDWKQVLDEGYKRANDMENHRSKPPGSCSTCGDTTYTTMSAPNSLSNCTSSGFGYGASTGVVEGINREAIEGINNFDSERLISHGVKLEDDEFIRQTSVKRSRVSHGRSKHTRRSKSLDRSADRQPRVMKSASAAASSLTCLFLRDSGRGLTTAARNVVGFNFCAQGNQLHRLHHNHQNVDDQRFE